MAKNGDKSNSLKQEMNKLFRELPAEVKDHSRRIQSFCGIIFDNCIASELYSDNPFFKKSNSSMLKNAVKYHDIGKIKVSKDAVTGFDGLQEDLWAKYKKHAQEGIDVFDSVVNLSALEGAELTFWQTARECVAQHHERWDGSGYPEGLSGSGISPAAMICAIANNLDYLTTASGNRDSLPFDSAIEKIKQRSGTYFDPAIVEVLLACSDSLQKAKEEEQSKALSQGGHRSQRALELLFKPVYDYNNRQTYGYRAQVRLNDKQLGELSPDLLISVAEKSNRINELFRWSLEESCDAIHRVESRGRFIGIVFVPISVKYLLKKNSVANISRIVEKAELYPERFCFMITENLIELDKAMVAENVAQLRQKGFQIALGGFGVEYSNLAAFDKLDVDFLELDESFVHTFMLSERAKKITENVIDLAKKLDTYVLAQGVSDKDQAKALFDLGCVHMQGDHFGKYQIEDLI